MDQQSVGILKDHLEEFLKYIENNQDKVFTETYTNASPAYEALALSG